MKIIHQGRNIRIFRELKGYKQEALAAMLGEHWSQKRVSILEARETISSEVMTSVAEILDIPSSLIQSFQTEEFFSKLIQSSQEISEDPQQSIRENLCRIHYEKIEVYKRIAHEKDCIIEILRTFLA